MDTSTKMTENSSGFHVLKIHMPSMGTGMGMLLLVGAAVLALRWWIQRWHTKKLWLQGGFSSLHSPGQAFEMGCRCPPRRTNLLPAGPFWERPGASSRSCPQERLAPPSPARPPLRPWAGPAVVPG